MSAKIGIVCDDRNREAFTVSTSISGVEVSQEVLPRDRFAETTERRTLTPAQAEVLAAMLSAAAKSAPYIRGPA